MDILRRMKWEKKNKPLLKDRIYAAGSPTFGSIHGPTKTAKQKHGFSQGLVR